MKKRLKFRCWKCEKTYELLREIGEEDKPKLSIACPFCGKGAVVELDPYREPLDFIPKGDATQRITVGQTVYVLPDILPTQPEA